MLFCYKIKPKIPLYFSVKSRIFSRPHRISSLRLTFSVAYYNLIRWELGSPTGRGTFGGHIWVCPDLPGSIFSMLFTRGQEHCGLWLQSAVAACYKTVIDRWALKCALWCTVLTNWITSDTAVYGSMLWELGKRMLQIHWMAGRWRNFQLWCPSVTMRMWVQVIPC